MNSLEVQIIAPDGTWHDVSSRVSLSEIGALSESLEDELLVLTHSDIDLVLKDADGELATMLSQAARDEEWQLRIERFIGGRRAKWDLIFGGVLDLPLSVDIDRKQKSVAVQAFSYSKLLEKDIDVESLRRNTGAWPDTLVGQRASITSGTGSITLDPGFTTHAVAVSVVNVGDKIALDDGTNREEYRVATVAGAATIAVQENAQNTFADAAIELLTPWPWHQTPAEIATTVGALAGIDEVDVDLENVKAGRPFLSGFDTNGEVAGLTGFAGMVPEDRADGNHDVGCYFTNTKFKATSPSSGLTSDGIVNVKGDWTPYVDTEPTLLEVPADVQNGARTDTQLNFDVVADDDKDWTACYDYTNGDVWTLRHDHEAGTNDPRLRLYKNGSFVVDIWVDTAGGASDQFHTAYCEFVEASGWGGGGNDLILVSAQGFNGAQRLFAWDDTATVLFTLVSGNDDGGGGVRVMNDRQQVAVQGSVDPAPTDPNQPNIRADINFWKVDPGATIQIDRTLTNQPPMQMWTMRSFGDFICCMYLADSPTDASDTGFQRRETRCRVWRWDTLEQVGDFKVYDFAHTGMFACKATIGGVPSVLLMVHRFVAVLSTEYVGTVPYINFEDVDAAAALHDIAIASLAFIHVDQNRTLTIRGRGSEAGRAVTIDLDAAIEHSEQPLTDSFVSSVEVSGEDSDGSEFSIVAGDKHDSANRASIDSSLVRDTGLAESLGEGYRDLLAGIRKEHNVQVPLDGQVIHANDVVTLTDGRLYRVMQTEVDFDNMTQELQLIEVLRKADA